MDPLQLIFAIVVILLMLGLGATLTPADFRQARKVWKAPLVAVLCQFVFMPLISFALAIGLGVTKEQGISMLVVGCSPGGSTSNLFAYYSRGDLPLSIIATSLSTLLSIGLLPLCLLVYSPPFTDEHLRIPFSSLVPPLVVVILPVGIGMAVRYFSSKGAKIIEKVASVIGMLFILAALVAGVVTNLHVFAESWKLWFASAVLMPIGGIMGYTNALLARLPPSACRTISLETGLQNSTLALAILAFSFPDAETFSAVSVFPLLYSLFLLIDGVLITMVFRYISRREVDYISEGKTQSDPAPAQESQDIDASVEDAAEQEAQAPGRFESVV